VRARSLFYEIALFKTAPFLRQALKQRRPRRGRRPRQRWTGNVWVIRDGDGLRGGCQRGGLLASAKLQSDLLQASKRHRFKYEP
jgi:hypothetical protein